MNPQLMEELPLVVTHQIPEEGLIEVNYIINQKYRKDITNLTFEVQLKAPDFEIKDSPPQALCSKKKQEVALSVVRLE